MVGTNVLRHTAQDEQIREHVDDIDSFQLSVDTNGQAFVRKLVDNVQHPVFPALMRAIGTDTLTSDGPAHVVVWAMKPISYARHRFPPYVIRHAIWLYLRFTLIPSLSD
jgi:hypothetical protein